MALNELIEQRKQLVADLQKMTTAVAESKRSFTAEENDKFERMHKDCEELKNTIDKLQTVNSLQADMSAVRTSPIGRETVITKSVTPEQEQIAAWRNWIIRGENGLSSHELQSLRALGSNAAGSATVTAGGYLAPAAASGEFLKMLRDMTGMLQAPVRILSTNGGEGLLFPTVTDTSNSGAKVDENPASGIADNVDPTFGQETLSAYTYTSDIVRVSNQLLQDSSVAVDSLLNELLAERLAAKFNSTTTTGDGSGDPEGITVGAGASGVTLPATTLGANASAIWSNINNIIHSISPVYRKKPSFGLMFNDKTLLALKVVVDSQNRPLWAPSFASGEPDRIAGVPYYVNVDFADIGASAKSIVVGDFSQFYIRQVAQPQFQRLSEIYAAYLQTGFQVWHRWDSRVMNDSAIKYVAHAAS